MIFFQHSKGFQDLLTYLQAEMYDLVTADTSMNIYFSLV